MKRRDFLKSVGLFGAGAGASALANSSNEPELDENGEPKVVFEQGEGKFSLVQEKSGATQQGSLLKGSAVLENLRDRPVEGEFQTYFIGYLDGETYTFQASAEVQHFDAMEGEEVSISTELTDSGDFDLKEYVVVFIQDR